MKTNNRFLVLKTNKGAKIINSDTIIRIAAISNYSKLYFDSGETMVVSKVLRWFEDQLPAWQFIRVHRTHFINKKFISQYTNGDNSKVQLLNGEWIDVARRKKPYFLQYLGSIAVH